MVSVHAFHRAKTTDEADNLRSNLNKDNFALHGSFVEEQHQLLFCNCNTNCFCSCALLSEEVWFEYVLCDCSFCFQAFVQRKYSNFMGSFKCILRKSISISLCFQTEVILSHSWCGPQSSLSRAGYLTKLTRFHLVGMFIIHRGYILLVLVTPDVLSSATIGSSPFVQHFGC